MKSHVERFNTQANAFKLEPLLGGRGVSLP